MRPRERFDRGKESFGNNMKPNIIMVVVDSLRADHVGALNRASNLTPHVDRFAGNSVVFQQAIAQGSSTPPSVKSFMSSTYPLEHDGPVSRLYPERRILPAYLRQAGYTTAGIVTNEYLTEARGWGRDFHLYDDCDRGKVYQKKYFFRGFNQVTKRIGFPLEWPVTLPASTLFERAVDWLDKMQNPFFLWIQTMDVHWPYRLQKFTLDISWQRNQHKEKVKIRPRLIHENPIFSAGEHEFLLAQYREAVRYTDTHIGMFLQELHKQGRLDDTVVVILSDHGEEFGEHGRYFHSAHLYDELIHTPLIFYLPGFLKPVNRSYPHQVRLLDITPTLLDLSGVPAPSGLRGASLLPALHGETIGDLPSISESHSRRHFAYRRQGWKYMLDTKTGQAELYDLENDPGEKHSCLDENPSLAAKMHSRLSAHIGNIKTDGYREEDEAPGDPELMTRLRDLGYVE